MQLLILSSLFSENCSLGLGDLKQAHIISHKEQGADESGTALCHAGYVGPFSGHSLSVNNQSKGKTSCTGGCT